MAGVSRSVRRALRSRHTREWAFVAAIAAAYSWLRWFVTPEDPAAAVANAIDVVRLEERLGLFVEQAWQAPVLTSFVLTWTLNIYYIGLHLPPIAAILVYTYRVRPDRWPLVRDVLVVFTLAGVVIHALYPLAPPWFMDQFGIKDTFEGYREDPVTQSSAGNPYAAMPSMHFGWALAAGVGFAALARPMWLRVFGVAHPLIMGFAIVVTGNHYVIDAIAATFLLALALGVVLAWHQWFPPPVSARGPQKDQSAGFAGLGPSAGLEVPDRAGPAMR